MRVWLFTTVALLASGAHAAIVSTQVDLNPTGSAFADDGVVSGGEYAATYANGGGSGFGGTVGGGVVSMDTDGANLYIAFEPQLGSNLDNNATLFLDTRAGGVLDAQMNDRADGGRNVSSNITSDVDDTFPIVPDFTVVFGGFGTVVFELNTHAGDESTSTDGHLSFIAFENDQTGSTPHEIAIPLATLGNPSTVDFFMAYASDTAFNSNESLPFSTVLNAGANPGFDNGGTGAPVIYENANRFTVVPEPSSLLCLTLAGMAVVVRRRF